VAMIERIRDLARDAASGLHEELGLAEGERIELPRV
jgi:hypothetical protein